MSTSQGSNASNASFQNSMKSYISNNRNLQFEDIKYRCDLVAPLQVAWKEGTLDPGRRFFGCSNYKDPVKKCNFFLWVDPSYPDRAREVIHELKVKLRMGDAEVQKVMKELSFVERKMLVLNEECKTLRKKLDAAAVVKEKELIRINKLLFIVVLAWFFCMFLK